jgi:hypothetical protein
MYPRSLTLTPKFLASAGVFATLAKVPRLSAGPGLTTNSPNQLARGIFAINRGIVPWGILARRLKQP